MKVDGAAFVIFVALALGAIMLHRGVDVGRIGVLLGAFILPVMFLSFRQVYYSGDFIRNFIAQLADLRRWSAVFPKPTLFYYSWDLLESQGTVYRLLVWASVPVVILSLFVRASLARLFVFRDRKSV